MKISKATPAIIFGGAATLAGDIALRLTRQNAPVAVLDADGPALDAMDAGPVLKVPLQTNDRAGIDAALETARGAHGTERLLVTCLTAPVATRILGTPPSQFDDHVALTLERSLGRTLMALQASATAMAGLEPAGREGERGVVVCVSSTAATDGQIGQALYAVQCGGLNALVLPAARELGPLGIRVCALALGLVDVPPFTEAPEEVRQGLAAAAAFPARFARPNEAGAGVQSMIEQPYCNGAVWRLDGGLR
ncbi:MAG: SDR family oxidoreductase [Pseudomonadota bacterium]